MLIQLRTSLEKFLKLAGGISAVSLGILSCRIAEDNNAAVRSMQSTSCIFRDDSHATRSESFRRVVYVSNLMSSLQLFLLYCDIVSPPSAFMVQKLKSSLFQQPFPAAFSFVFFFSRHPADPSVAQELFDRQPSEERTTADKIVNSSEYVPDKLVSPSIESKTWISRNASTKRDIVALGRFIFHHIRQLHRLCSIRIGRETRRNAVR